MFHRMHGHQHGHSHPGRHCGPRGEGGRFGGGGFGFGGRGDSERGLHGGGGRGGRGPRMFDGGELKLVLLKLIADAPCHGYDLIRQIEELTGGAYAPSPGVIYPTLALLDEMGLIEAQQAEGAKKLFAVTPAGTAHLEENAEAVATVLARLGGVRSERERTDATPIRRAMGNLREVLRHRLTAEGVDTDTLFEVAALIDELSQKIERLK